MVFSQCGSIYVCKISKNLSFQSVLYRKLEDRNSNTVDPDESHLILIYSVCKCSSCCAWCFLGFIKVSPFQVSDFGLANHADFNPSGGKFPIKWTAPEALRDNVRVFALIGHIHLLTPHLLL